MTGILYKLFSMTCFAGINIVIRYLSVANPLPANNLVFWEHLIALILISPWIFKTGLKPLNRKNLPLSWLRVIIIALSTTTWYLALSYAPISQAIILNLLAGTIFTVLFAVLFLKERLDVFRSLAIIISVIGAFFVLPSKKLDMLTLTALIPILSVFITSSSKVLTRKLAISGEKTSLLISHYFMMMMPVSLLIALPNWQWPNFEHVPYLLLMGVLIWGAHFGVTKAFKHAEITFLLPLSALKFLLNSLLAFVFLSEWAISGSIWVGLAIVLLGTALLAAPRTLKTSK